MNNILIALLLTALVFPSLSMAGGDILGIPIVSPTSINLKNAAGRAIGFGFGLLLILAVVMIIYAAYVYLTAGQNPANLQKANGLITYAVVAIVVAFFARGIILVIQYILTGTATPVI